MAVLRFPIRAVAAIAVLTLAMAGCKKDARNAAPPATATVVRDTTPSRSDTIESGGEVVNDAAPVAGVWITDANALSLLAVMTTREIVAADRALGTWRSDSVRVFAEAMLREHRAMQHAVDSVAAVSRTAPVGSALADPVGATMQAQMDSVQGVRGAALDRAFMRQQIASHELMVKYLDQLAAVSERSEVQELMSSTATRVRSHLARARGMQTALAIADSTAAADSAAKAALRGKRQPRDR